MLVKRARAFVDKQSGNKRRLRAFDKVSGSLGSLSDLQLPLHGCGRSPRVIEKYITQHNARSIWTGLPFLSPDTILGSR